MHLIFFSALIFIVISCGSPAPPQTRFSNSGVVLVMNGRGQPDSLRYTCDSCYEILGNKIVLDSLVSILTSEAKASLRNQLSFIPRSVDIQLYRRDSMYYYTDGRRIDTLTVVIAEYTSIGKNGYGVEGEVKTSSLIYLVNNRVADIGDRIRKDSLRLEGKVVSRSLTLSEDDGTILIQPIMSSGEVHLIVHTDESCVEDARLSIYLEGNEEIKLRSWNDFNCKGNSYFRLASQHLAMLKSKSVQMISYSEDAVFVANVPRNERDYFIQYVRLIEN